MWTPSDRLHPFGALGKRSLRAAAIVLMAGLSFGTGLAIAAPQGAGAETAESRQELRDALEERYEVLPIRNGVVLRPRTERLGVRTIEVTDETIAVNGERVSAGVLRAWLGEEEAEAVLRLQGLGAAGRRELFHLGTGGETPPAPPAGGEGETEIPPTEGEIEEVPPAPEPPAEPAEPAEPEAPGERDGLRSSGSRVKIGGGVTVERDELADEVVAIGGPARVLGEVERDVVAVGGSVTVEGRVNGEVVAVGGSVRLGPRAVVDGNVTSVGGSIHSAPGARINGSTSEVGLFPAIWGGDWDHDVDVGWPFFWGGVGEVVAETTWMVFLALLVCIVLLLARRPLERADHQLVTRPWQSLLAGFLSQLLFLPILLVVTVLLAITIIGCALFLLYPFLFLGLLLLALLGYAAVAYRVGRLFQARFGRSMGSPYLAALLGVLLIQIWAVIGHLIGVGGGPLRLVAFVFLFLGWAASYAAWTMGFGAVLLARFGTEPGYWPRRTAAVPPVVPPPPPAGPAEHLPLSESFEGPRTERWEEPGTGGRWEGEPR
jgi:cytoskeletal protein CcmA (bactofilin family)